MAQRYRASANIQLARVDAQDVGAVDGHGGESLVDFDKIDVGGQIEIVFAEELGDGERRSNAHYPRGDTCHSRADELGQDGLIHLLCF